MVHWALVIRYPVDLLVRRTYVTIIGMMKLIQWWFRPKYGSIMDGRPQKTGFVSLSRPLGGILVRWLLILRFVLFCLLMVKD